MIKYLSYAAPLILKTSKRNPVKKLTGLLVAYLLLALSFTFSLIAVFIWVSKTYGADAAFAVMGLSTFATALILLAILKDKKKAVVRLDTATGNDPMAKYIPDTVKTNPTVQKLMHQVGESPITATATAVTIGMLLSRELFEET